MDKRDYSFPLKDHLGNDLNRRSILADEVCRIFGMDPHENPTYKKIFEVAAGLTYGKYRFLLGLCLRKEVSRLKRELSKLLGKDMFLCQ